MLERITELPFIGARRAALLTRELGIRTVSDLLYYVPFRYTDRTRVYKIDELTESITSQIQVRARLQDFRSEGVGAKARLVGMFNDGTATAEVVWFKSAKWIEKSLERGREYLIFGKPQIFNGRISFVHPEIDLTERLVGRPQGGLQGVYSTTEVLSAAHITTRTISSFIAEGWKYVASAIKETLPEDLLAKLKLMPLREALYNIHFPSGQEALKQAQYRLKFEELLGIQLVVLSTRATRTTASDGFLFPRVGERFNALYDSLPFPLTAAQKRVIKEIRRDTISGHQMNRLLQGDVGSGKTLVALLTMLLSADNGYQSCIMAPTEILARQHYASIGKMLGEGSAIKIAVLTGATKTKERKEILEQLAEGEIDILVGTHALLEERVQFANLAMVVIDEQHRFGVEQRSRLWTKNLQPPHILVMTATPIPRTLAMTLYGDLDVSVIDELPPGRKPIMTYHWFDNVRLKLYGFMKRQIEAGRQIYVVYPLIKESESMDYKNLISGYEEIVTYFPEPQYNIVAVHGRLSSVEKQAGMEEFASGRAQIMVATSVIEVGVDIPNATVMVIESAERFGLSQLHQLRGRVGRGGEQSYSILMSSEKLSREARARLKAMVDTNDGFRLSELDMKLRGTGDISGTAQSGEGFNMRIASLSRDGAILTAARRVASHILSADPTLTTPANALLVALRSRSHKSQIDFSMIS